MRKWKVGDEVDRTLDESVEHSLDRIRNAFLNVKSWDEVMSKRKAAVERQKNRAVESKPCQGFSFSTTHYPPALLNLLRECDGVLADKKLQFTCSYHTERTNANTIVISREGKWIFNGCCFGCQTLKDVSWNAVKNYFICIKVSNILHYYPNQLSSRNWINGWGYGLHFVVTL